MKDEIQALEASVTKVSFPAARRGHGPEPRAETWAVEPRVRDPSCSTLGAELSKDRYFPQEVRLMYSPQFKGCPYYSM